MTEVVDATAVEDVPIANTVDEIRAALPAPVSRPVVTNEVLRPLDIAEQAEAMQLYQDGLKSLLADSDWQSSGKDKFVKKSGWRKIAAWFNLSIELVRDEVERDDAGQVQRAKVWARAIAPNGRFADGDGYCDISESRFAKNKTKLENDLRGTATTRAVNRAISNLVGMGAVSAEEVDAPGGHTHEAATEQRIASLSRGLMWAFDGDAQQAEAVFESLKGADGVILELVASAVVKTLVPLHAHREPETGE